jgi:DNA polymerase III epsilon subunit-like protein
MTREDYISVDVETSGPNPSSYALLSIGACLVADPELSFYVELKPTTDDFVSEAMAVHHLSLEALTERGLPPREAMTRFAAWLGEVVPDASQPIFVAFNAPFDWMFVNDYFHRYLGMNPFGHSALDLKALYMGLTGAPWRQLGFKALAREFLADRQLTHHALEDAQEQAQLFNVLLERMKAR